MDCEVNLNPIRALEEQIREHEKTAIRLKHVRNSLLNVSKPPPEVLGKIFHWNVTLKGDFGGLDEGSHNFPPRLSLLVRGRLANSRTLEFLEQ